MVEMVEKEIRGEICNAIHQYSNENNEYMNHYNKDLKNPKESYLMYWNAINL